MRSAPSCPSTAAARDRRRRLDRRHPGAPHARAVGRDVELVCHDAQPRQGRRYPDRAPARARATFSAILDADLEYAAATSRSLIEPLISGEANVVFGLRAFDVTLAIQLLVRDGEQGRHARDQRDLQLLDLRRHDLPQGDAHRPVPVAPAARARVRDRARDHGARAALGRADLRGPSRTGRARARRARSSPRSTGSACSGRSSAAACPEPGSARSAARLSRDGQDVPQG